MASLVIDIGNTYTKVAVFELDELTEAGQHEEVKIELLNDLLRRFRIKKTIISTVKKAREQWESELNEKVPVIYFNAEMTADITNHYQTPHTLGLDRLAGVIGAHHLYPKQNNLVIDGGTCIKYDYVDAGGNYFGGSISPGLNMRYKALNYYTAALPVVNEDMNFNATYGDSTQNAILSGVQNGIKYELTGFIESYSKQAGQLNIILSGGDSIFFDTLLKNSIFAPCIKIEPYLVLKGLNAAIQKHND
jgi:type III pantothenate kinase